MNSKHYHFYFLFLALFLFSGSSCAYRSGTGRNMEAVASEVERTPSDSVEALSDTIAGYGERDSGIDIVERSRALEIPAPMKGTSERILKRTGFEESYNAVTRIPNWVAWHLTAAHTNGPIQRKDYDFTDDESVPDPKEYDADYHHSGWTHGHLCPAGDNKWSAQAMADCFLVTNMCPQAAGLNSGLWNTIEKWCREWAKAYGEVYIVCGPVFLQRKHQTIGENRVVVPEAFFKVVLCMKGTPKAIGFICRNRSAKGKKPASFVNTVGEVERITGINFFPSLPNRVMREVENHCDLRQW